MGKVGRRARAEGRRVSRKIGLLPPPLPHPWARFTIRGLMLPNPWSGAAIRGTLSLRLRRVRALVAAPPRQASLWRFSLAWRLRSTGYAQVKSPFVPGAFLPGRRGLPLSVGMIDLRPGVWYHLAILWDASKTFAAGGSQGLKSPLM